MAIILPDARQLPDDVLQELRLRALRGCEMGLTQSDVAGMLGLARETVSRWWSAYRAEGPDGLPGGRTGRPVGSGRAPTDEQATRIQQSIDEQSPEELGVAAPLWSRPAVRDLIHKEYGVRLPVRTVGEYLKRWGYTAKRPQRHAKDQDPEEVREWLEETYPEIDRRARAEKAGPPDGLGLAQPAAVEARGKQGGAEIDWCDETGVAADEHPRYGYGRRGEQATMQVPKPHIRVNVISTVNNVGQIHFMTHTGMMNAALFIEFPEQLLRETDRKVILITDRLSAHDCAAVEEWLLPRRGRIEVHFLPRRAPESNPDEYFNNDLKGNVHAAGLPNGKKELEGRVKAFLRKLVELPERVASYFRHPRVQYAAGS